MRMTTINGTTALKITFGDFFKYILPSIIGVAGFILIPMFFAYNNLIREITIIKTQQATEPTTTKALNDKIDDLKTNIGTS